MRSVGCWMLDVGCWLLVVGCWKMGWETRDGISSIEEEEEVGLDHLLEKHVTFSNAYLLRIHEYKTYMWKQEWCMSVRVAL